MAVFTSIGTRPWVNQRISSAEGSNSGLKKWADVCTVTSRPLWELLREELKVPASRTLHLPSGCDVQIKFPESRAQARSLTGLPADTFVVGRTSSSELITEMEITAMLDLAERFRSLTGQELVYYSIGPCNPEKYPRLFGSKCRIRVTGRLKPEEVPVHLASCDVFLLVEDDRPICRFRGPIRLNDYLAAGRPILCNDIGDHVQTLVEHPGLRGLQ